MTDTDLSHIADMPALRAAIDDLDRKLARMLAERTRLIARAAEIKAGIGLPARIDDRVEEVVANAGRHAASHGLDRALIEAIWRQLVEAAIAQEDRYLDGDRP